MGTPKRAAEVRGAGVTARAVPAALRRSLERARRVSDALRKLGKEKGRDSKLWTDAIAPAKGSAAAAKPAAAAAPSPSCGFVASLPIRTTEGARARIRQLKAEGIVQVRFPADVSAGAQVVGVKSQGGTSVIGLLKIGRPELETDPEKATLENVGLLVRLDPNSKTLLEFVVRAPALPKAVRSRSCLDQGGLRRNLTLSKPRGSSETDVHR